jgi:hypothetical protein
MSQDSLKACSKDQKWRWFLSMKLKLWREKLLTRNRVSGSTSIGIILCAFLLVLLVILPMLQLAYELQYINVFKDRIRIASELAVYVLMLEMNADAISEKKIVWNSQWTAFYQKRVEEKLKTLNINQTLDDLSLNYENQLDKRRLNIYFKMNYPPVFLKQVLKDKTLNMDFSYYFPIND